MPLDRGKLKVGTWRQEENMMAMEEKGDHHSETRRSVRKANTLSPVASLGNKGFLEEAEPDVRSQVADSITSRSPLSRGL